MINVKPIVKVKKLVNEAKLPTYALEGDAGADIYALCHQVINSGQRALVKTGIAIELPENYEAQVRSKSGLALKNGLFVLNSPGTIEHTYRGEVGVIILNTSNEDYIINPGQKIAQLVVKPVIPVTFIENNQLTETVRGSDGFGSTGV